MEMIYHKTKEEIDRIRKGLEIGTPSYSLKGSPYETEDRRQIRKTLSS